MRLTSSPSPHNTRHFLPTQSLLYIPTFHNLNTPTIHITAIMQSNDMPATTASSSSGNIVAPTAGSASGNAPLPATAAPQVEPLSHPTNTSVVAAITQLNLLPRTLHNHAKDASETRKAEVQSWLEHHQEEFDRRVSVSETPPFLQRDLGYLFEVLHVHSPLTRE